MAQKHVSLISGKTGIVEFVPKFTSSGISALALYRWFTELFSAANANVLRCLAKRAERERKPLEDSESRTKPQ